MTHPTPVGPAAAPAGRGADPEIRVITLAELGILRDVMRTGRDGSR